MARLGLSLDLLFGAATLIFPYALGTSWRVALANRPELCVPLLTIGLGLCALGAIKAGTIILRRSSLAGGA